LTRGRAEDWRLRVKGNHLVNGNNLMIPSLRNRDWGAGTASNGSRA
jgi:hypothetical protein